MAVPGRSSSWAPADLAATELFAVDAYATEFAARVARGRRGRRSYSARPHRVLPGGGGQPYDLGTFESPAGTWP